MSNKVKYGLSNVYYSTITEEVDANTGQTTYAYAAPKKLPGAVELALEAQGETVKKRADNMDYYVSVANNGYSGDLTMAKFPETFLTEVLGVTKAANGVMSEYSNVKPKGFALLFQFEGDANAIRHALYNCKCTRPDVSSATTEDNIETKDEKITITASPRADYLIKGSVDASVAAVYENWFKAVTLPGAAS